MDNPVQLPLEIVAEILLKLPVKSILQFKTVCKCWNSIINDTHFTKRHLKLALSVPDCNFLSLCYHHYSSNPLLLYTQHPDGAIRAEPFCVPYEHERHSFCNSCDGLMCFFLVGDPERIFVWNPCLPTLVKIIPTLPYLEGAIALGYDPTYNDYKVVKVPSNCLRYDTTVRVETFSFKANSWKTMRFSVSKSVHYLIYQMLVYARNRVHWLATEHCEGDKENHRIMYFDLVGESLELVNLPSPNLFCPTLMNYKDSIAVSGLMYDRYYAVDWVLWVLEDHCGMKSSWKKMFRIKCNDWDIRRRCLGVTLNGECFVNTREDGLRIYDPKDGGLEDVIKRNHIIHIKKCVCSFMPSPYVQSLVSPTQLH